MAGPRGEAPRSALNAPEFARMMRNALDAIQERGHAQVGDKTMVDAFAPAVEAMEQTAGRGFAAMLRGAEQAARAGMERTKEFEAKFGRAKTQGTTIGYQDAGATSVWVIMKAMADYVERCGAGEEDSQ